LGQIEIGTGMEGEKEDLIDLLDRIPRLD